MSSSLMATNLAQLIGLDEPTVSQQILPYMSTMSSAQEVKTYLETLLPPGAASQAFIRSYLAQRFPPSTSSTCVALPSASPEIKVDAWGKPIPAKPVAGRRAAANPTATIVSDRRALEGHFASTGKVYLKNRDDDDGGWGGSGSRSRSASRAPSTSGGESITPVIQSTASSTPTVAVPPPSSVKINPSSSSALSAQPKTPMTAEIVELSESARSRLSEIDSSLRLLRLTPSPSKRDRSCFCSARCHPLSPYAPLCRSCGLILCSLNPPSLPCPSCSNPQLVSPTSLSSHITLLETQRSELLDREKRRRKIEQEREALERAAIRFPELGEAGGGRIGSQQIPQGRRGYADLVGGGKAGALEEKIEKAYAEGKSVNGREFGRAAGDGGQQKVLRLDMKTRKVKVQTKTKVVVKTQQAKVEKVVEEEVEEEDEEWERWIDETDDGWRERHGFTMDEKVLLEDKGGRAFLNLTLAEEDRPRWIEPTTIDLEPLPAMSAVEVETGSERRSVPGAAQSKGSEGKKGRNRKKGGKNDAVAGP